MGFIYFINYTILFLTAPPNALFTTPDDDIVVIDTLPDDPYIENPFIAAGEPLYADALDIDGFNFYKVQYC
jgi:hypothetical protein